MKRRWTGLLEVAGLVVLSHVGGCGEAVVGGKRALTDHDGGAADRLQVDRSRPEASGPDLCPVLGCNWCQGTPRQDAHGCVVGFTCANGVDPCLVQPCAPGDPTACQPRGRCEADRLCWPCGAEVCNGKDDDCNGLVDDSAACPAGEVCTGGKCASACASGQTRCASACVDLQTSPTNCGACSVTCAAGETCIQGACQR